MRTVLLLCFLTFSLLVFAHEGHEEKSIPTSENIQDKVKETTQEGRPTTWTQWVGSFHLILLHFPIALINMLGISELLLVWLNRPIFDFSSRFLSVSSSVISPPTALLGLVYSYSASYEGLMEIFLWWHMWLGLLTAIFAVIVVLIREGGVGIGKLYYGCLFLLFSLVNIAGFFGGGMTFGPYHMSPPI
jgi:uncharacterized membrane protein